MKFNIIFQSNIGEEDAGLRDWSPEKQESKVKKDEQILIIAKVKAQN